MHTQAPRVSSARMQPFSFHSSAPNIGEAATTSSIISPLLRQRFHRLIGRAFYGSFIRDICDKYLTVFADFKYVRSFFDTSLAAVPFVPDPFKIPGTNIGFSPFGISVPISNPFNPFTVRMTPLLLTEAVSR